MELVQWIFETESGLSSALGPKSTERLGLASSGKSVPRAYVRGPELSSVHLPHTLRLGLPLSQRRDDSAVSPASVRLRMVLAGDSGDARDPISPADDDLLVLARLAELTDVMVDLLGAVELPVSSLVPRTSDLALELTVAPIEDLPARLVTQRLVLFAAAMSIVVDARGMSLARSIVLGSDERELAVNLGLTRYFIELTR